MNRIRVPGIVLLALLAGCKNNSTTDSSTVAATLAKEKSKCVACIGPKSRSAFIMASYKAAVLAPGEIRDMVMIHGGAYRMGSEEFADSRPVHTVTVKSFYMDTHEVTNAQFAEFVKATGYVTVAEQKLNPKDYPDVPADKLVPGSAVFTPPGHPVSLDNPMQWWTYAPGASWKHPKGPGTDIKGKASDPVVQVCYTDAAAYAKWAGKRLPTEAEWEYAARAGKNFQNYYWGTELKPGGKWLANIFQGHFPDKNAREDGFMDLAPVKSFPANPFGLYDMEGNVWEWCSDLYRPDTYTSAAVSNPSGPRTSLDPEEPGMEKHVQRGGSFLCSDDYCIRYKAGSRGKGETSSAGNNLGFRCVRDL